MHIESGEVLSYLLYRHLDVQAPLRHLGLFKRVDAGYTVPLASVKPSIKREAPYYANLLWISVIAGTLLAFENGFHRLINNHHPETVSPKLRGELSSI